jgi:hypothetical protein
MNTQDATTAADTPAVRIMYSETYTITKYDDNGDPATTRRVSSNYAITGATEALPVTAHSLHYERIIPDFMRAEWIDGTLTSIHLSGHKLTAKDKPGKTRMVAIYVNDQRNDWLQTTSQAPEWARAAVEFGTDHGSVLKAVRDALAEDSRDLADIVAVVFLPVSFINGNFFKTAAMVFYRDGETCWLDIDDVDGLYEIGSVSDDAAVVVNPNTGAVNVHESGGQLISADRLDHLAELAR